MGRRIWTFTWVAIALLQASLLAGCAGGGGPPGKLLEVVSGNFNRKNTEQALEDCSECVPHDWEQHDGTNFYSWGEDFYTDLAKRFEPPAFDHVGMGGRIAVLEHHVFRTVHTRGMESLIDAYHGKDNSLADNDEFRSLAEEIAKLGVYSAAFPDQTMDVRDAVSLLGDSFTFTQEELDKIRYEVEKAGLLRPYLAYASGTGKDEEGKFWALVLLHPRANLAEDNVDLFRERMEEASSLWYTTPWSDMIDSMEVRSDDGVMVAKLYGGIARIWLEWIYHRDSLIPHE